MHEHLVLTISLPSQDLLSDRGMFYLVAVPENKPLEIIAQMKARGLDGEVSRSPRCRFASIPDNSSTDTIEWYCPRLSSSAAPGASTFTSSASPAQHCHSSFARAIAARQGCCSVHRYSNSSTAYIHCCHYYQAASFPTHSSTTTSPLRLPSSWKCEFQSRRSTRYPLSRRSRPTSPPFSVRRTAKQTRWDGHSCHHPRSFAAPFGKALTASGDGGRWAATNGDGGKAGSTSLGNRAARYASGEA